MKNEFNGVAMCVFDLFVTLLPCLDDKGGKRRRAGIA